MGNHFNHRVENLLCLNLHFPFFFGETIIHENIDMRNYVKCNFLGEILRLFEIINKNPACLFK